MTNVMNNNSLITHVRSLSNVNQFFVWLYQPSIDVNINEIINGRSYALTKRLFYKFFSIQ